MYSRLIVPVVLVCTLLVACGGGGGGSGDGGDFPTVPTPAPPPTTPVDAPSIEDVLLTGSVQVGGLAIATPMNYQQAQWAAPGVHQYQWEQRPDGSSDWAPIPDVTGPRFVIPTALAGKWIRCGITPVAEGLSTAGGKVFSAPVGPVAPTLRRACPRGGRPPARPPPAGAGSPSLAAWRRPRRGRGLIPWGTPRTCRC